MSYGCDFVCENRQCKNTGCKIPIHGAWEIALIDAVAGSGKYRDNHGWQKALAEKKANGMKHALVPYPNTDDIPVVGYRVQFFCPVCLVLWDEDYLRESYPSKEAMLADIKAQGDSYKCRKCGHPALSAKKAKNEGIDCPGCHKPLNPIPWMVSGAGQDKMK